MILIAATLSLGLPFSAGAQTASPTQLEKEAGYMLRDGGEWIATNPLQDGSADKPRYYVQRVTWGPKRADVDIHRHKIMPDKRRISMGRETLTWDPIVGAVRSLLVSEDGARATGLEQRIDHRKTMIEMRYSFDDQTAALVREFRTLDNKNEYEALREEMGADGIWHEVHTLDWVWRPDGSFKASPARSRGQVQSWRYLSTGHTARGR